jgi:hypothetical protein
MQNSTSAFWLQDLIGMAVYVAEELKLNDTTAQTMKGLLEGNCYLKSAVKHADGILIPYRPMIVTSNGRIYDMVSSESVPIGLRALELDFIKPLSEKTDIVSRDPEHQRAAWAYLMHQSLKRYPLPQLSCPGADELLFEAMD